jgi:hypothetical protein
MYLELVHFIVKESVKMPPVTVINKFQEDNIHQRFLNNDEISRLFGVAAACLCNGVGQNGITLNFKRKANSIWD